MDSHMLDCSWRDLAKLLDDNDGAVFIAHSDRFKANVAALREAFEGRYRNIGIGYSYKTNHLPKLCIAADVLGLYAEVVSGTEFEIALALGVTGERILFNGPVKGNSELKAAFAHGALVNVDSLSEARQVAELASEQKRAVKVGLRCNLDLTWKDRESRFGLSETSGELDEAWRILNAVESISIEGLHCHTSFDRSAKSYGKRIAKLIEIADRLFNEEAPRFLDIGGGLCGPMSAELREQFATPPPTFEEYAESICDPIVRRYGVDGPELIIEPGVGLLGNVFDYAYRVEHVKKIGSKFFAVTSGASHHIKIVPNTFNLPTSLLKSPETEGTGRVGANVDIAGYTCLEHDVIYRDFAQALARGDILVSKSVGAYSMVSSPDFIRTSPPVFERSGSEWKELRKKQSTISYLSQFNW